ncbi:MAG: biotin--[acetyl-CoA-carboxylase] ligase [Robiginitomaculum sp.]|nr:MAG: biotin--[acetyl-CoA-carboxylase] ligase [Robiginitomaculum sp.]
MRFVHFKSIDSTNAQAKRYANPKIGEGDFGPIWISADNQTHGIGRRGREWVSNDGNLFCTGLYPQTGSPASAARLSFAAALAVAQTLDTYIDPSLVQIKWPNDVLVNGKKISGILLESGAHNGKMWTSIGIGMNLTSCPDIEGYDTTYLLDHIAPEKINGAEPLYTGAQAVLAILAQKFDYWFTQYNAHGFSALREAWLQRARGIGGDVTVRLPNSTIIGTALGMDEDGALEVRVKSGDDVGKTVKIHAGDVFFSAPVL